MTTKSEQLTNLLMLAFFEIHLMFNHLPTSDFKRDQQKRLETLIAEIWKAQE